ncbi:beta-lactamase/transpeptidase-like protein [Colletotrichum falcatum]|nr:beta-lactamase/transpeptidase-like protein [Colletotrichum falcatum]
MSQVHGACDSSFEKSEEGIGAAIAVNLDCEGAVNLWGGCADGDCTQPWNEDTISPGSGPSSAANGKENVEIRHMLSHTSGVSGWESNQPLTFGNISGLDAAADKLAAKAPWWEPGTALGYHSWTLGHLLAAVVRRATGSTLQEFAVEEIVKPLGAESQLRVSESICPVLPTMTMTGLGNNAVRTYVKEIDEVLGVSW